MTDKVYVVTDLGPGDGGKGGVVHKIVTMKRAHTVIKRGGAQGSHGVQTSMGEKFAFSQWGCGTLNGIPTHISGQMIVHPEGLINEANMLKYQLGIHNPFSLLTIDENSLCTTPYHGIASCLKELARGNNPRGTVGTGVGESYRLHQTHPELSILVRDLKGNDLKDRLVTVREFLKQELRSIIQGNFLKEDLTIKDHEIDLLYDKTFLDHILKKFKEVARIAQIVHPSYLGEVILQKPGVAVVETSHGVLTDRVCGFNPHTSAIRTLPRFTHELLKGAGYHGQIVNLGVTRAYAIRHGAGPMPTHDPDMANRLLPGSHKQDNRWQGKVRVGPMDFVLLRYAIAACGGVKNFDGLAITCFDQAINDGNWKTCLRYSSGDEDPDFFTKEGDIVFNDESDKSHFDHQIKLTQKLWQCIPKVTSNLTDLGLNQPELYRLCASLIEDQVRVPVRMVSFGPTEADKICK